MDNIENFKNMESNFQFQSSSSSRFQMKNTDRVIKVNDKLLEFVNYFVKEFEAKLHIYDSILEGEIKKAGKFSDTFSEKIGQGIGGAAGGFLGYFFGSPVQGGKLGSTVGKIGGEKLGNFIGNKKHIDDVTKLLDLINDFKKNKISFRQRLVENGFDVFQSFEMQFMRVTTEQGTKKAMQLLAQDAVNRAINYMKNNYALISEGVISGKSKRSNVFSVNRGMVVEYEYQSCKKIWNTGKLYKKTGLFLMDEGKSSFYKKKDCSSDTYEYGYRRLFTSENWNNLKEKYDRDDIAESCSGQFVDYQYILNSEDLEQKSKHILKKINSNDKDLEEDRIKELIEEVKNDLMQEINFLKEKDGCTEDFHVLERLENILKDLKVDKYLEIFKKYFEEAKREIIKSIETVQKETKENFNQLNKKQDVHHDYNKREHEIIQKGIEEAKEEIIDLKIEVLNLKHIFVECLSLPQDDKSKIEQNVTRLHKAVSVGNKINVFEALQEEKVKVNAETVSRHITPLHLAAQGDHEDIVESLLNQDDINVNTKTDLDATPLHYAAQNGNEKIVEKLINKGADVNAKDIYGSTPLHLSAQNGHEKVVEVLLKIDSINVNSINNHIVTALHYAAQNGHVKIVEKLINKGSDINAEGNDGSTPLHVSAQNGHEKVVEVLLKIDGINVNSINNHIATPLHYAAQNGHVKIVEKLINKGSDINAEGNDGSTPLQISAQNGHEKVVEVLVKRKYININSITDQGATPLHYAVENGHEKIVEILVNEGAKLNVKTDDKQYVTPLHIAARLNFKNIAEILLNKGADVNSICFRGFTPLHIAAALGKKEVVEVLLDKNADVNAKTSTQCLTPFYLAVQGKSHLDVIKILLKNGADINVKSADQGSTSLHVAAEKCCKELVELLLNNGAEVNVKTNQNGRTPLHIAAEIIHKDNEIVVEMLLDRGAAINATDNQNLTPLHIAAGSGNKDIVNILIKKGANINFKAAHNFTPLHLAVQNGHIEVVRTLLVNGANIEARTFQGATPLYYACKHCWEIAIVLLEYGAYFENFIKNAFIDYLNDKKIDKDVINALVWNYDVNASDERGWTPLHKATKNGNVNIFNALIKKNNINIDAQTYSAVTSLHIAIAHGHLEIVKVLLKNFANPNIKDKNGKTPLMLITEKLNKNPENDNFKQIRILLLSYLDAYSYY